MLVGHVVATVAYLGALLLGETTRISFLLLYVPRQPILVATITAALLAGLLRSRVFVALECALTVVVVFPVMGFVLSAPKHADRPVRLLSYNVFFGKLGRGALLDEIESMSADVILLQAANDSMGARMEERFPGFVTRQDGELVISTRFPIREATVPEPLPSGAPAMFVRYVLETPSGPLEVFNIHPYSPREALFERGALVDDDVSRREAQVGAAMRAARSAGAPFVIAGDTNLPGLSRIARRHFGELNDAFDDAGTGFGYTFPAKYPWMRLDRVLSGRGIRFVEAHVAPRGASDHRCLLVQLEIVP
jgi:vancomycin resistance protein VanJ